eukprot:CAMPEP_0173419370 /NCGR_PEP_ID=MMETSP1357-20121228/1243_1 /TAXON_ID=77926 /ORGANISM="Hemiselmis rufescens, Strain PCC563" /LENGTH=109 /DNA_ID=CAMNT_0014382005 /DNA_START=44 /DNA_END=373 /DNA_ORIENTATION=-
MATEAMPKPKVHAFFGSWMLLMAAAGGRWFYNKYREVHYPEAESFIQKRATMRKYSSQEAADEADKAFKEAMRPDGQSFVRRVSLAEERRDFVRRNSQDGPPPVPPEYK